MQIDPDTLRPQDDVLLAKLRQILINWDVNRTVLINCLSQLVCHDVSKKKSVSSYFEFKYLQTLTNTGGNNSKIILNPVL
jgi:hypothetical protein